MKPTIVILAAGMGTRLGNSAPKCLTKLDTGETIMGRQLAAIKEVYGDDIKVNIVVGYKSEAIIEEFPNENFIHNDEYDITNTSKSLLKALSFSRWKNSSGVLWFNGDVVYDKDLLFYLNNVLNQNTVTVNTSSVSDEEVKYTVNSEGKIDSLSKVVPLDKALGEAVGINFVSRQYIPDFMDALRAVGQQDYFEKGIERMVNNNVPWVPFDISYLGLNAVEVDFAADLDKANATFAG